MQGIWRDTRRRAEIYPLSSCVSLSCTRNQSSSDPACALHSYRESFHAASRARESACSARKAVRLYTLSILCPLIGSVPQWVAPSLQLWLTVYIVCAEHFTTVDRVPTNWRMCTVWIMLRWLFEVTRCIRPDAKILQVLIFLQCFHILHYELLLFFKFAAY